MDHPILQALDRLFESSMTNAEVQQRRAQVAERDAKERELRKTVVNQSAEAISCLADAIRYPHGAITDLAQAAQHVSAALRAARELEQEDA